jgi:hypothetical protein
MKKVAYVCFINALLEIPFLLVYIAVGALSKENPRLELVADTVSLIGLVFLVYINQAFRGLLTEKLHFAKVDRLLLIIILYNVLYTIYDITDFIPNESDNYLVALVSSLILGVCAVIIGKRLLTLDYQFEGLLKPFAYLNIAIGVLYALLAVSELLIFLIVLLYVINDIIMGTMFLHAAKKFGDNNAVKRM